MSDEDPPQARRAIGAGFYSDTFVAVQISGSLTDQHRIDRAMHLLTDLYNVRQLVVRRRSLGPSALGSLGGLTSLEEIDFEECALEVGEGLSLTNLRKLTNVSFYSCRGIRCALIDELSKVPSLKWIDLGRTDIDDRCLPSLCRLTSVEYLVLHESNLSPEAVSAVRSALPNTEIYWEPE
jgi:hypothetical protein